MKRYVNGGETAFDNAIRFGSLELASNIITSLNDDLDRRIQHGELPSSATHLLIKELAMPMFIRAEADIKGTPYPEVEEDISALYGQITDLMAYFQDWDRSIDSNNWNKQNEGILRKLIGVQSELTIFGLIARASLGTDEDRYTIWPASQSEDRGFFRQDHRQTGFDFIIQIRDTLETVRTQVKTSRSRARYTNDILVVSLRDIAGNDNWDIFNLQDAMITEVAGLANPEQVDHINQAYALLEAKIAQQLQRQNVDTATAS